ncbi:PLD nuclease N-terminal domain-containing protein [Microbacterium sp. 179-I 3D4 NHS]|uniref:PLD nuclease N-terminal domain-containing protein n=1 Tax=Microbacterium sp. 179-I 3D4 NHS TaxID=3142381 RepID=UPI0039A30810
MLLWLLIVALMVGAVVDIVRREDSQVRFLPRIAWIAVVILLPLVGSLLWFGIGREYGDSGIAVPRLRRPQRTAPAPAPAAPPADVRTTEQQIADLDREIEEWRLREEIEKRKHEHGPRDEQGPQGDQDERRS